MEDSDKKIKGSHRYIKNENNMAHNKISFLRRHGFLTDIRKEKNYPTETQ